MFKLRLGERSAKIDDQKSKLRESLIPMSVGVGIFGREIIEHISMVESYTIFEHEKGASQSSDQKRELAMLLVKSIASNNALELGANAIINSRIVLTGLDATRYGLAFYGDAVSIGDVPTL